MVTLVPYTVSDYKPTHTTVKWQMLIVTDWEHHEDQHHSLEYIPLDEIHGYG